MRHALLLVACLAAAATAEAQYGHAYAPRQTAMGALGQVNVLGRSGPSTPRVAARNNAGSASPARGGKPFAGMNTGPTVSPYLNMFRDDSESAIPNYYAFVRPQQEQYEAARMQQAQLQQLQRQVRQATYQAAPTSVGGGARYGDTGRYYSGWRR